jgi:two-component sensor histidine kinase
MVTLALAAPGSLGIRLARTLTEQLGGELQVARRNPGTEFGLEFALAGEPSWNVQTS